MTDDSGDIFARMLEQGRQMAEAFARAGGAGDAQGWANAWADAMPTMPAELMETFWGKGLNPEGLDARTRLLLMIAGMTVQGVPAEAPFRATLRHARAAGASTREIAEAITQMSVLAGLPATGRALQIARDVLEAEGGAPEGEKPNREGAA